MADSLRDQLLKSGIVKPRPQETRGARPVRPPRPPDPAKVAPRRGPAAQSAEEIDLARAYALRKQSEAAERRKTERTAAEQARLKRERKLAVQQLLRGQALNKADAEHARHFEYGGRIRRIYVDAEQLAALNAGSLGVVQLGGRYLLVTEALARKVAEVDAHLLALLPEPGSGSSDEDGVPDDLIW